MTLVRQLNQKLLNFNKIGLNYFAQQEFSKKSFENNPNIPSSLKQSDFLWARHMGPQEKDMQQMLALCNATSLEDLMLKVLPQSVYDKDALDYDGHVIGEPISERFFLQEIQQIFSKNKLFKNYIGGGYYGTILPPVIQRHLLENPVWYTSYTPYQGEVAQGRLESLLNYQTIISEITGLPFANASLLDEGTSAAEAMIMSFNQHNGKRKKFFISKDCFPQTIDVIKTKAYFLGIECVVEDEHTYDFNTNNNQFCGALVQSPNNLGIINDYSSLTQVLKQHKVIPIIATDLFSCILTKTPADQGFEVAVGSSQRFGVPLGFGGPHAAFFAVVDSFKRKMPGRIIGVSVDAQGKQCLRMAMQTREQHIRREKATSNICTAQALLANIAAMYGVYHGPDGLRQIAERINQFAQILSSQLIEFGFDPISQGQLNYFDTVAISVDNADHIIQQFEANHINIRKVSQNVVSISFDETSTLDDLFQIIGIFAIQSQRPVPDNLFQNPALTDFSPQLKRTSKFMQQPIFNTYKSETQLLRYLHQLQDKDFSLAKSMIPLGSCTMKLNSTSEMMPLSWEKVNSLHPFVPLEQAQGYMEMIDKLTQDLKSITKFDAFSYQSQSGAMGEYNGLVVIRSYLQDIGQGQRDICLIPLSAHGTNPASAVMAGLKVISVKNDEQGNIDLEDLKQKAEKYRDNLAAFMVTYPSTFGIFEANIKEAIQIVHDNNGQVYMDGANMNAQVGWTSPGFLGADVCHLNLHKTFAIPHGGGGPGHGPIGVKQHLAPYLPNHKITQQGGDKGVGAISSAHWSSTSILTIPFSYIRQLGHKVKDSSSISVLNANYLANRLKGHYNVLFSGQNGLCAHEFVLDIKPLKEISGITEEDVAKRLMDFGFHAPTMSWPVHGTLMIEPTESEDKQELDRFADALIKIRQEIQMVITGKYDKIDNPLKNAPHTQDFCTKDQWNHCYSRQDAGFPLPWVKQNKLWPSVARIDNVYGDRNLVCTCPSVEELAQN